MISIATLIAAGIEPTQARQVVDPLVQVCERFDIQTVRQQSMFVAQMGHESDGFTRLEENLRWRDPKRLNAMFSAIKSDAHASELIAKGPQAIANVIYGGRNGNGPPESGDGWKYRGRGWTHLTGLANYFAAQRDLGEPYVSQPDLVATTPDAALTAGWFWDRNHCNDPADSGAVDVVTRIINGPGMAGLEERRRRYVKALTAFR